MRIRLVVLAFVLAGCGGDDDAAPTTSEMQTTTTERATTTTGYEPTAALFDGTGVEDQIRCAAVDLANFSVRAGDLLAVADDLERQADLLGPFAMNELLADPEVRVPITATFCAEHGMAMLSVQ